MQSVFCSKQLPDLPKIKIFDFQDCGLSVSPLLDYWVQCAKKIGPLSLKNTVLVVPTQRLSTSILAHLSEVLPNFFPPEIWTLEPFLQHLLESEGLDIEQGINHLVGEVILEQLISELELKHTKGYHAHELFQFFTSLSEMNKGLVDDHTILTAQKDMERTKLEKLIKIINDDVYKDELLKENIHYYIDEILQIHEVFYARLQKLGTSTKTQISVAQVQKILANNLLGKYLSTKSWVCLLGFTTVKPFYKDLLTQIYALQNSTFWFHSAKLIYNSEFHPINGLIEGLEGEGKSLGPRLRGDDKRGIGDDISIHTEDGISIHTEDDISIHKKDMAKVKIFACETPEHEVSAAAKIVEQLLREGFCPHRIGVLLVDEELHGPFLGKAFAHIEKNQAVSLNLRHTVLGDWLEKCSEYCQDPKGANFISLWLHPLSRVWFNESFWPQDSHQFEKIYKAKGYSIPRFLNDDTEFSVNLKNFWQMIPTSNKDTKKIGEWTELLQQWFGHFSNQIYAENTNFFGVDEAYSQLANSFRTSMKFVEGLLSFPQFIQLVCSQLKLLELRPTGYPLQGVQILRFIESRHIPFDAIILVGANEGRLPRKVPKDRLVDDWFKTKMDLPGWGYVEALEELSFQLLMDRIPHVWVTYGSQKNGKLSKFVKTYQDEFNMQQSDFVLSDVIEAKYVEQGNIQIGKKGYFPKPWLNEVVFSPSLTEKLFQCSYSFMLSSFELQEQPSFFENFELQKEGRLLHKMVEIFFQGGELRGKKGEPFSLEPIINHCSDKEKLKRIFTQRIKLIHQQYGRRLSPFFALKLQYEGWEKFIHFVMGFFVPSGSDQISFAFKNSAHELKVKGFVGGIKARGVLDFLAWDEKSFLLVDFKRKAVPTASKVLKGIAPQLGLYAICLENELPKTCGAGAVGYWSFFEGEWSLRGESKDLLHEFTPHLQTNILNQRKSGDLQEIKDNLRHKIESSWQELEHIGVHVKAGDHCEYCSFANTCRV